MPIAIITFGFDPILRLGPDIAVRWQTVALAAVLAILLVLTGLAARRSGLRADDLLTIAVGAVPGAVLIGRVAWIAAHPGVVAPNIWIWLDPGVGGLDLAAGVVGGIGTAALIAGLLGAPVGRWGRLLAVPLLVALGAGKLTMILGGSGQGLPSTLDWATAYEGPGPWGSLAAAVPSHPAQAYEGLATLALALVLWIALAVGGARRADGRALALAVIGWLIIRIAVSVTWRDPVVAGPFGAAAWIAVLSAVVVAAGWLVIVVLDRRSGAGADAASVDGPVWPDPETRPRF